MISSVVPTKSPSTRDAYLALKDASAPSILAPLLPMVRFAAAFCGRGSHPDRLTLAAQSAADGSRDPGGKVWNSPDMERGAAGSGALRIVGVSRLASAFAVNGFPNTARPTIAMGANALPIERSNASKHLN